MSHYLVLIYEDEKRYADADETVFGEVMAAHDVFGTGNKGSLRGGEALAPTTTATSIRADGAGGFTVTDGPFAETNEALGGYYVVEAADLDAAIAIAKQVPARFGGVEVRPVMTFE